MYKQFCNVSIIYSTDNLVLSSTARSFSISLFRKGFFSIFKNDKNGYGY